MCHLVIFASIEVVTSPSLLAALSGHIKANEKENTMF